MRRRAPILLLAACMFASGGLAVGASADDRDDLVQQQDQNQAQMEQLQSTLEGTTKELQDTYLALEATRQQLPIAEQELRVAEGQLAAAERVQQQTADRLAVAEAELDGLASQITQSQDRITQSHDSLGALARSTYRNGTSISTVSLVLGSASTDDFITQFSAMDSAVRSQTAVLTDMSELEATTRNAQDRQAAVAERIADLKAQADQAVVDADAARDSAARKRAEIVRLQADQESLALALESRRGEIETQQSQIEQSNAEIAQEIAAIDEANRKAEEERLRREEEARIAEEQRLAAERQRLADEEARRLAEQNANSSRSDTGSGAAAPAAPAPAAPAPAPASSTTYALGTPIPGPLYVTSPYGYRVYPITGGWYMHYGVDLRSSCGNRQNAVADGTVAAVKLAYNNGTHGNQVVVNNGMINGKSYVTVYNHLSSFAVSKGQSVSRGQAIGYTGATGNVTGCHVHFEVWINGTTIDPMTLPGF